MTLQGWYFEEWALNLCEVGFVFSISLLLFLYLYCWTPWILQGTGAGKLILSLNLSRDTCHVHWCHSVLGVHGGVLASEAAWRSLQGVSKAAPCWTQPVLALQPWKWHLRGNGQKNCACSEDWGENMRETVLKAPKWEKEERKIKVSQGRSRGSLAAPGRPWWGMGKVWGGRSDAVELLCTDSNPRLPILCITEGGGGGKGAGNEGVIWKGRWKRQVWEGGFYFLEVFLLLSLFLNILNILFNC